PVGAHGELLLEVHPEVVGMSHLIEAGMGEIEAHDPSELALVADPVAGPALVLLDHREAAAARAATGLVVKRSGPQDVPEGRGGGGGASALVRFLRENAGPSESAARPPTSAKQRPTLSVLASIPAGRSLRCKRPLRARAAVAAASFLQ